MGGSKKVTHIKLGKKQFGDTFDPQNNDCTVASLLAAFGGLWTCCSLSTTGKNKY